MDDRPSAALTPGEQGSKTQAEVSVSALARNAVGAQRTGRASPLVRFLTANNPSPYTASGTRTHLVGGAGVGGDVAVIDPGPDDPPHIEALLAALGKDRLKVILCTHSHIDHSPGARALAAATGAPILGGKQVVLEEGGASKAKGFDLDYAPDRILADGDQVSGDGWTLEAVATPGHTSNHLCFALLEEHALFSGDHVMGWATTVIFPPDGDMGAYMESLGRLLERSEGIYYPAHGDPVTDPAKLVRGLLGHRRQREAQIRRLLEAGTETAEAMAEKMYPGLDARLRKGAAQTVLAHLIGMERRGEVHRFGEGWTQGDGQ